MKKKVCGAILLFMPLSFVCIAVAFEIGLVNALILIGAVSVFVGCIVAGCHLLNS